MNTNPFDQERLEERAFPDHHFLLCHKDKLFLRKPRGTSFFGGLNLENVNMLFSIAVA
jgi:hypothetical protein